MSFAAGHMHMLLVTDGPVTRSTMDFSTPIRRFGLTRYVEDAARPDAPPRSLRSGPARIFPAHSARSK